MNPVASTPLADGTPAQNDAAGFFIRIEPRARGSHRKGKTMNPIVAEPARRQYGRGMVSGMCLLGAMYLAFAVGAPWVLREAPPDTYTVIATTAACAAHLPGCAGKSAKVR
jgi:hypothetical protein